MKKIKTITILIAVIFLFISCGEKPEKESKNINKTKITGDNQSTKYPVKVEQINMENVSRKIEYTANLSAFEEIYYAPASPGRIEKINVEIGDRVKMGDIIALMDKTQLLQAEEQFQNAKSNFQRMDTLYRLKSISEQQYEMTKTQYEVAKAQVEFLRENTTLRSPINGIVTGRYYESGELFSGAPNTKAGKAAIVTLMQINPLKALLNVSEKYFPELKKGMKVNLKADIFPGENFFGEVFRFYPVIDPETRSFQVEVKINNQNEALRPGMFARVELILGEEKALVVPANAVLIQQGTNNRHIYTVSNDSIARKIDVQIANRFEGKIEIISNEIKEGDPVIIAGQEKLIDSTIVNIVK